MTKWFEGQSIPMGLDINDMSLKIVQFVKKGNGFSVLGYSDNSVPKDVFAADKIKNADSLSKVIREAVAKPKFGNFSGKEVVASIPETRSFVRVIQIPRMSEDEAKEAVAWEAEAYIPLPISQVYLDWMFLGPAMEQVNAQDAEKKINVLITAAPRDYVDDLVKVIKNAGLRPVALEIESQATARSLIGQPQETVLIADIDTVRTSFIIAERGVVHFTSSAPIAGNSFTESISKALSVNFEEAEEIKREYGIDPTAHRGALKKNLMSVLKNLTVEIKNTIRFHDDHSDPGHKIPRLLLSGGSSKLKHLPSFLHEQLSQGEEGHEDSSLQNLRVELGNPWTRILKKGETPPMSREDSLSFATAIGLGLREIEL